MRILSNQYGEAIRKGCGHTTSKSRDELRLWRAISRPTSCQLGLTRNLVDDILWMQPRQKCRTNAG